MIQLRGLHPALRTHAELTVDYFRRLSGVTPAITSVTRTVDQQRKLYDNFLACRRRGLEGRHVSLNPGMTCAWPANPPGYSAHNYGLAWDSTVPGEWWDLWNRVRRAFGWRVPDSDRIHAEYPEWRKALGIG